MNQAHTLRLSLLTSLGLVGLACGGATSATDGGGASAGTGGDTQAGTGGATQAGSSNHGGSSGMSMGGSLGFPACTEPTTDPLTGLVTCGEGYVHRPKAVACGVSIQKALPVGGSSGIGAPEPTLPRATEDVLCGDSPENCNMFQYGYCGNVGGGAAPSVCRSGCINDEECGDGYYCACDHAESPTTGVCQASSCRTDADCDGFYCAQYNMPCGGPRLSCLSADDECRTDDECGDARCMPEPLVDSAPPPGRRCVFAECGRPFLVGAQARVAPLATTTQWRDMISPRVVDLSEAERGEHAAHWSRLGQLEHASIAAFARFSLQLLSLGAPPELVEGCTRALADETAHARLCFGLASAYAGHSVGPGRLDVSSSLEASSLPDVVDLVLLEGCIGETKAALEALEAVDNADDPVIAAAYARIAADEQRHAELAFQFIRWALARSPATVRSRIEAALASNAFDEHTALAVAKPCLEAMLSQTPQPQPVAAFS